MNRNQHISRLVFCPRWDFDPVLVFPQVLCLDKINPMFFTVGLALRNVEREIHLGIESIPVGTRSSIQEDSTLAFTIRMCVTLQKELRVGSCIVHCENRFDS